MGTRPTWWCGRLYVDSCTSRASPRPRHARRSSAMYSAAATHPILPLCPGLRGPKVATVTIFRRPARSRNMSNGPHRERGPA
eukprot:8237071-Pyramimonas_sp.AAC.1